MQLLKELKNYINIFSEENAAKLSNNTCVKHVILIKKDKKILYKLIYFLFVNELWVLYKYLESSIIKDWIRNSKSSVETSILFILKKNNSLRLYVNYRDLNQVIIRNKYLLSLISKILN